MRFFYFLMISLLLITLASYGQVLPAEGSSQNYLLTPFQWAQKSEPGDYELQIAAGLRDEVGLFTANIVASIKTKAVKAIVMVPEFGSTYSWRVLHNGTQTGTIHHFLTQKPPLALSSRLTVNKKKPDVDSCYFFVDGHAGLYDARGRLVWFVPAENGIQLQQLRDLKHSGANTITAISGERLLEMDYNARPIWTSDKIKPAPQLKATNFHHEFVRLGNGHYMSMGNEVYYVNRATGASTDGTFKGTPGLIATPAMNARQNDVAKMPNITEFDADGHLVWQWRSANYFANSDIYFHWGIDSLPDFNPHCNAFFFDEAKRRIYISFKNLNRVICISYPAGEVIASWGETYADGRHYAVAPGFSEQHSTGVNENGNIYLLNNRLGQEIVAPSIVEFSSKARANGAIEKTWEYVFHPDWAAYRPADLRLQRHGGKVQPVFNSNYFVSLCSPFSTMYVVTRSKKILFEATPETWNAATGKWEVTLGYRADLITRTELEKLIWASQTNR